MVCPVIYVACSLASYKARLDISSVWPSLCNGIPLKFLFAFKKNSLFKQAYAYAWNNLENKVQEIALNESFPFYCHYLTLSRPKRV